MTISSIFVTTSQHGFVENRSVVTNMLSFLKEFYEAIGKNAKNHVTAFFTDFSKAFDKVPHYELFFFTVLTQNFKKFSEFIVFRFLKNHENSVFCFQNSSNHFRTRLDRFYLL